MADRPHEVLGVPPGADADQVRQAFKRRAKELHPDVNPDPTAAAQFVALKAARDVLLRRIERGDPPPRPTPAPGPPRATPHPTRVRPARTRPEGLPPDFVMPGDEPFRLTWADLYRPALYGSAVLVLVVAFWMFVSTMERAAAVLAPGGYHPPPPPEAPAPDEPTAP